MAPCKVLCTVRCKALVFGPKTSLGAGVLVRCPTGHTCVGEAKRVALRALYLIPTKPNCHTTDSTYMSTVNQLCQISRPTFSQNPGTLPLYMASNASLRVSLMIIEPSMASFKSAKKEYVYELCLSLCLYLSLFTHTHTHTHTRGELI